MTKQKEFIQNRKGLKIAVLIEQPENEPKGLVFVVHGLSGSKEDSNVRSMADVFLANSYTTVTFDTTNTFGESDGTYENANLTNSFDDLEDVVAWSKSQAWYKQPFCLAGQSLGGATAILFAQKYPHLIKALAPISFLVSGKLLLEKYKQYRPAEFDEWERTGARVEQSKSRAGLVKKLNWLQFKTDLIKYDLLKFTDKLTMPILAVVGEKDFTLDQVRLFSEKLPDNCEFRVVENAPHDFVAKEDIIGLQEIFDKWLKSL